MAPDTLAGHGSDMSVTCFCTKKPSSPVALESLEALSSKVQAALGEAGLAKNQKQR